MGINWNLSRLLLYVLLYGHLIYIINCFYYKQPSTSECFVLVLFSSLHYNKVLMYCKIMKKYVPGLVVYCCLTNKFYGHEKTKVGNGFHIFFVKHNAENVHDFCVKILWILLNHSINYNSRQSMIIFSKWTHPMFSCLLSELSVYHYI